MTGRCGPLRFHPVDRAGSGMDRRRFLILAGAALGASAVAGRDGGLGGEKPAARSSAVRLFLCGDVMTGRGIDQVLAHPSPPRLFEPHVRHAGRYVELAEALYGPIPRPVGDAYVWGDALAELERRQPDLRIVNLETAVTRSHQPWPGKGIHYRMQPANVGVLTAAEIDACVLANNHVLDWGHKGLIETLETLHRAGIRTAGAGRTAQEAEEPAILEVAGHGRVILFAFGSPSSGIPGEWAARGRRPGVALLEELSEAAAREIGRRVARVRGPGDLVVASIHWGPNWGYAIPAEHRRFARWLVEAGGVDVLHGHSSHHPLGMEVVAGRPVLYGCGDFINDYEGIGGYERYRSDLALAYFLTVDLPTGELKQVTLTPFQSRRFRLQRASEEDVEWLRATVDRECRRLGTWVEAADAGALELRWAA